MSLTINAKIRVAGGYLFKVTHQSTALKLLANFNIFLPPAATGTSPQKVPVLFYLSGLTATADNCAEKGGFFPHLTKAGVAMVLPDTSPRGANVPGEDDSWDFGSGAGFYIDATQSPWNQNYRMETYITEELPNIVSKEFPIDISRMSITGHSMGTILLDFRLMAGGHGALTLFLRNPGKYKSVSAFSPISNPSNCPWGEKAFLGYLGPDKTKWAEHDATELIKKYQGPKLDILIDVGTTDSFYKEKQLLPENFIEAAKSAGFGGNVKLRYHEDYDHGYYFISTFAQDHVAHAAKYLQ